MIISSGDNQSKQLIAISFETSTYRDLGHFLNDNNPLGYKLSRLDPYEFLKTKPSDSYQYINLVTKDMGLRELISETIDVYNLQRFTFVHEMSYTGGSHIGPGCLICPMVSMYTNVTLVKDNIVHMSSMIAHNAYLDVGSYVSAGVNVGGTTKIGKFCNLGLASIISDGIEIVDHVVIGMGTMVRKSITEHGVYVTQPMSNLTRLK